jgi:mannose/fructose/N-acetylgalactosamine-specific phosphotransferase system component IID
MKLAIPENYTLPEDVEDGQTFEELVTFRVEGTSLVPTMLAGVEIPMEDTEDEAVEDMEEEDMAATGPMAGMGERIMGMA